MLYIEMRGDSEPIPNDLLPFRPFPFHPLLIGQTLTLTLTPNPQPKWQEDEMGKDEMETYLPNMNHHSKPPNPISKK